MPRMTRLSLRSLRVSASSHPFTWGPCISGPGNSGRWIPGLRISGPLTPQTRTFTMPVTTMFSSDSGISTFQANF